MSMLPPSVKKLAGNYSFCQMWWNFNEIVCQSAVLIFPICPNVSMVEN